MPAIPDKRGRFGKYGGQYVPETLMPAMLELEEIYARVRRDRNFQKELQDILKQYVGRPTPLYFAKQLTKTLGGAKVYLKREDLCHTGAHKINNAVGHDQIHEEETNHCRNRRWATWGRRCHRRRQAGA